MWMGEFELAGLAAACLAGWAAGAIGNWAADILPHWGEADSALPRTHFAALHYLTLGWYLFRRGTCPHCGQRRPWRAPALEIATIAAFLLAWLRFGRDPTRLAILWLYAAYLLVVLVIDLEHRRVLNVMLIPAAITAFLLSLLPPPPDPLPALLGGAVGLGLFLAVAVISRGKMGAGDVKLAGLIGLMAGYPDVLAALALGIVLGGAGALVLLVARRAGRKSYIAYAPYLALGALVTLFQGLS
jgi:leader peptidase (prepilin peptidase)/N-methyltransferase